jgi:8-oxo-dGTP diphosphatase
MNQPTIRNVVLLFLFDEKRRLLFQHRTDDAPVFPGLWSFFGGGIEEGETPLEALKREIVEELNYKLTAPSFAFKTEYFFKELNRKGERNFFIEKYDTSQKLELHEGQNLAWFFIHEALSDLRIPEINIPVLKRAEKLLQNM